MNVPARPLRVLISGREICGLVSDLAGELKRRGYEVRTAANPHRYFEARYDYSQTRFSQTYLGREHGGTRIWNAAVERLRVASPARHRSLEKTLRVRAAQKVDLYLRVWAHLPFDAETLPAAKASGAKVATFLMGSDVRDYDAYAQQYGVRSWTFAEECFDPPFEEKLKALRLHERYSDAIFSVPDQMGLALRPYNHLQIPITLERFQFHLPDRAVPRVIHAPSAPYVKGTDVIERAVARLMAEGIKFEFISLRDIPHRQMPEILRDADVLVDELVVHGPGWLSMEAMASGCAVATRSLPDSPVNFRPPVWRIDEYNIVDRLRILLSDRAMRMRLASEGREYVERNNGIATVVDGVLAKINDESAFDADYHPDFLVRHYEPRDANEVALINAASRIVAEEPWYKATVAGNARAGLSF